MWLAYFPQILFLWQSLAPQFRYDYFESVVQQFLLLGIVPGTNVQLTLNDILLTITYIVLAMLAYKLCSVALHAIDAIDPDKDLPPGIRRIDLIAL